MPLRSVEAATRDDAIAAAREQFGPSARVVGVRRVRSGGVLGFFATERYVAEVANDQLGRPEVPAPAAGRPAGGRSALTSTGGFASSPLSAAAPATAAPSTASGRAPARNGAAAWAAAAGAAEPAPSRPATPGRSATPTRFPAPAWSTAEPASRADEDRVSELAGLLGAGRAEAEPAAPVYGRTSFPRASFPRATRDATASLLDDEDDDAPYGGRPVLPEAPASAAPSPFTAALARMVSGDRDVRQAVEQVLEQPMVLRSRGDAEVRPSWSGFLRSEDTSAPSFATRQEEETVGDQVIAPPSMHEPRTTALPNWAVEPEPAVSGSPREEAIAEVLRSALAQGHSDEALAGILRKVLAGASPQTALTEPAAPEVEEPVVTEPEVAPAPVLTAPVTMSLAMALAGIPARAPEPAVEEIASPVVEAPAVEIPACQAPVFEAPVVETPAFETPAFEAPAFEAPAADELIIDEPADESPVLEAPVFEAPVFETPLFEAPVFEAPVFEAPVVETPVVEAPAVETAVVPVPEVAPPAPLPMPSVAIPAPASSIWGTPADSIWGGPASHSTLWGEPVASSAAPTTSADAPIWAEIVRQEPVVAVESAPAPVAEPALDIELTETVEDEPAPAAELEAPAEFEAPAEGEAEAAEIVEAEVFEAAEVEVAELAPMLARTASDPAPMSLDATTVMPPLSLLPPLPGSRAGRRGRPPVPPSSSRPSAPAAPPSAPSAPSVPATPAPPASSPSLPEDVDVVAEAPVSSPLATVTRLPVAPLMATPETPEMPGLFDDVDDDEAVDETVAEAAPAGPAAAEAPVVAEPVRPAPPTVAASAPGTVAAQLEVLGVPENLLGATFATDVETHGTYAALTRALGLRLPKAPELPTGAGEVLFVVGPGVETLRAARSLAAMLRLDPDTVQWATRGDLAGLAPKGSRVTTADAAIDRRLDVATAGTVTIVAVDAPMRTDAYWTAQMMTIWAPVAVWAVVEATRKPEDLMPWIDGLPRVDALIVQDTDLSADPAAVLRRVAAPVAILDGVRATPHRWASLLCERLEDGQA
ncbi:MAG: hypothetical protein ACXVFZ_02330 [Blastococcus sp.]